MLSKGINHPLRKYLFELLCGHPAMNDIDSTFQQYYSFGCSQASAYMLKGQKVGNPNNIGTCFCYVDYNSRIRGFKWVEYDSNGHRIHAVDGKPVKIVNTSWQCLFGEHLLTARPNAHVCIVESEKTAIICAMAVPHVIWLATGGKGNLRKGLSRSGLKGRKVFLFPDVDGFEDWQTIANEFGYKTIPATAINPHAGAKDDIADAVVSMWQTWRNENSDGAEWLANFLAGNADGWRFVLDLGLSLKTK